MVMMMMMMMMMMMNCLCDKVDRQKTFSLLALFTAGTIIRDPHRRKSLTRLEQDLNLGRT